jgi:hypothetical protein
MFVICRYEEKMKLLASPQNMHAFDIGKDLAQSNVKTA